MKKYVWIIGIILAVSAIAAATVIWLQSRPPQEQEMVFSDDYATHDAVVFEEQVPPADPLIVGKWSNADNPQWFKVYYDDFDDDMELYWGKEWNEADDVLETDLRYHGNGWFRWDKRGNTLREFATMDARDVPIAKIYTTQKNTPDSLVYVSTHHKGDIYRFAKVRE